MALDEAIADLEAATPTSAPPTQGAGSPQRPPRRGPQLRLIDVALDVMFYGGFSTENDESISTLARRQPRSQVSRLYPGAGGAVAVGRGGSVLHRRGAHPVAGQHRTGESTFEVEEAFLTTTGLPLGLQLEVGYFLTEFGIINAQHPHSWDWIDMPVVNSRMFGGDGMRQGGFRASWLLNTPWFSQIHFGMQNANGVTMASFLGGELVHAHGGGGHDDHGHGGEGDAHGAHGGETHDAHGGGRAWS